MLLETHIYTIVFNKTFIFFQSVWDNLKRRTVEKAAKSWAGGVVLTRVENLVLDAIGKDGAYLNGVGHAAPYPSFSGVTRPTDQGVATNSDSSLNVSSISNWNQSFSHNNILDNYGGNRYDPPALLVFEDQARNSSSTVARPPSPGFQFTAPFDWLRPQVSSTPLPRPQNQAPAGGQLQRQLPDQLPDPLTEWPGMYIKWRTE